MKKWQAVFWDFDGVVLDSVDVKTKAFARMFSKYGPEIEMAVVDYHLAHGGVSRFEKFRYYFNHLLGKPISEAEIISMGNEFSALALEEVLAAPFIPGALETLNELKEKQIPCYVISGTPEEELRHIVQKRMLSEYFMEMHGAPKKKSDVVSDIINRKRYDAGCCLFIGDAMTDYEAATMCGTRFIGVVAAETNSTFPADTCVMSAIKLTSPSLWLFT